MEYNKLKIFISSVNPKNPVLIKDNLKKQLECNPKSYQLYFYKIKDSLTCDTIFHIPKDKFFEITFNPKMDIDHISHYILQYLSDSIYLTDIAIELEHLSDKFISNLSKFLLSNNHMTGIHLENCCLKNNAIIIAKSLGNSVNHFSIESNMLDEDTIIKISHELRHKTSLKCLNISKNIINQTALEKIVTLINITKSMVELHMSKCDIGNTISYFFEKMKSEH